MRERRRGRGLMVQRPYKPWTVWRSLKVPENRRSTKTAFRWCRKRKEGEKSKKYCLDFTFFARISGLDLLMALAAGRFLSLVRPWSRVTSLARQRSFHTSNIMSKEQIEELEKNPFFDKYADKIAKMQK